MNNPEYVKVDNEYYKINTDFRVALECNKIANDKKIGDYERALKVIYMLFGEKGLDCKNQNKLIELATKYLALGNTENSSKNDLKNSHNLDFEKCEKLISSSFKYDYNYDPYKLDYLHWYDFYTDLENLSTSEFGNCCVLNRISSIINYDTKKIQDSKERQKMIMLQKDLIAKYCIEETQISMTETQKQSAKEFYKSIGIEI